MKRRRWENLPRPDRVHHTVEDFLTLFTAPLSHILPLRRFLESVFERDMRHYFAEECLQLALTHRMLPHMCQTYFMRGEAINGFDFGFVASPIVMKENATTTEEMMKDSTAAIPQTGDEYASLPAVDAVPQVAEANAIPPSVDKDSMTL